MPNFINSMYFVLDHVHIWAKVDQEHGSIFKDVLRVPYSSSVQLYCQGSGVLIWEYRNTKLLHNTTKTLLSHYTDGKNNAVLDIYKFDQAKMGFYTCRRLSPSQEVLEKTVLVTSGKTII